MSTGSFKGVIYKMCLEIIYLIYIYKKDLAINNLQLLICHKTKPNQTKPNQILTLSFSLYSRSLTPLALQFLSLLTPWPQ